MNSSLFNPVHIALFSLSFIAFTIIGTLSHEYGHIAVAKSLGYETTLHYGSMDYDIAGSENVKAIKEIQSNYCDEIENDLPFPSEEEYAERWRKHKSVRLWIRMGGPLQTMLTGTIGFVFLLFRKKKINSSGMKFIDWIAALLSLFWLRQVFNLGISIVKGLLSGTRLFGGDEYYISLALELPVGTFSFLTALLGFVICSHIIFKIIPRSYRPNFILGGLIGGVIGFILWMKIIGPWVLP